jgi:dolichol kinase
MTDSAEHKPIPYRDEVARKLIHLASAAIPLLYWFTNKPLALAALAPLLAAALGIEALRLLNPGFRTWYNAFFGNLYRPQERWTLSGATYVLLAAVLTILLFEKRVAVAALLILSISDSAASLVGRRVHSFSLGGKSIAGSGAFLLTAGAILLWLMRDRPLASVGAALAGTLAEALPSRLGPLKIDDNLLVPLAVGAVATLLS